MTLPVLLLCLQALPLQLFQSPLPGSTSYLDLPDLGGSPTGPITRAWAGDLTSDRAHKRAKSHGWGTRFMTGWPQMRRLE